MKIHQTFILSIGFLFGSALFAQSTALLNDSFSSAPAGTVTISTSGSASVMGQNAPATGGFTGPTARWFPNGGTTTSALTYTNAATPGTTGTLSIPNAVSQGVTAYFVPFPAAPQSLNPGDALTLTFNLTLSSTAPQNNGNALRFGLFNSDSATLGSSNQSTSSTGNNAGTAQPNLAGDYSGYYGGINPNQNTGASNAVVSLYARPVNANTTFISSQSFYSPLGTSNAANTSFTNLGSVAGDTYKVVLTVYYQTLNTTMLVIGSVYDTNISTTTPMTNYALTATHTATLGVPLVTSFDGLSIGGNFNTTAYVQTLSNVTVTYIQNAALPIFSPGAGSYVSAQSVSISSIFPGLSFAYTTDGSTPTETNGSIIHGTPYTTPIAVNANTTLKAIGFTPGTGANDNGVATAAYVINLNGVSAPVFSPAAGNFTSTQSVSITTITSGASIAYTTDGSTPTESGGTVTHGTSYSGPVSIAATTTLKAIAFKPDNDSPLTSGTYTISAATSTATPATPLPYTGPGGGALDDWFLALLALAGLLRWRQTRR